MFLVQVEHLQVRQVYRAKLIWPNRIVAVFLGGWVGALKSRKPFEFQGILIFETRPILKCRPPTWWWLSLGRGPTQAISAWFTTTLGDLYTMHNVTIPSYVQAADFAQKLSHLVESQMNIRMFRSMVGGKYCMKLMVDGYYLTLTSQGFWGDKYDSVYFLMSNFMKIFKNIW